MRSGFRRIYREPALSFLGLIALGGLAGCASTGAADYVPSPSPPPYVASAAAPVMPLPTAPPLPPETITANRQEFVYVQVTSTSATNFHWIVDSRWNALGNSEPQRRAELLASPAFGPDGVGTRVPLLSGTRYRFVPICDGRPRWTPVVQQTFHAPGTLELRCQ